MGSELIDGVWHHDLHQSDVKAFNLCLERGRASYFGEVPRVENAAAGMGTALHAAIEQSLDSVIHGTGALNAGSMTDFAMREFATIMNTEGATWGKVNPEKVSDIIARACIQFQSVVLPELDPIRTEAEFNGVPVYNDSERRISVSGVIDLVDARLGLVDWKLIARAYRAWEYRRWDIQSTVYGYAASMLGWTPPGTEGRFNFGTFIKGKDFEWLPVERTRQHFQWLQHYLISLCKMIESSDPKGPWVLNDNGWWCSADWCSQYPVCKGAFLGS